MRHSSSVECASRHLQLYRKTILGARAGAIKRKVPQANAAHRAGRPAHARRGKRLRPSDRRLAQPPLQRERIGAEMRRSYFTTSMFSLRSTACTGPGSVRAASAHDIFGRTIEFLTQESKRTPCTCVMKRTISSGVTLPLHNHRDDESFFSDSGRAVPSKGVRRGTPDNYTRDGCAPRSGWRRWDCGRRDLWREATRRTSSLRMVGLFQLLDVNLFHLQDGLHHIFRLHRLAVLHHLSDHGRNDLP